MSHVGYPDAFMIVSSSFNPAAPLDDVLAMADDTTTTTNPVAELSMTNGQEVTVVLCGKYYDGYGALSFPISGYVDGPGTFGLP